MGEWRGEVEGGDLYVCMCVYVCRGFKQSYVLPSCLMGGLYAVVDGVVVDGGTEVGPTRMVCLF